MSSTSAVAASFQPELWTCSSNKALKLFVTGPGGAVSFPPAFTYPIFGDAETIYGYQDLEIFLCFDHYTFYPFYNVKYSAKLPDPEIVDVQETMASVLSPLAVFKDEEKWVDSIEEEKRSYKIPGDCIFNFISSLVNEEGDEERVTFEVYRLDLLQESALELHRRLQVLILLFIEAGSYIDSTDPNWNVYVMYKKNGSGDPTLVGFTTVYEYWKYPGHEKFDEGSRALRMKISQFIILPSFQGQRLGQDLYSRLFDHWHLLDQVSEIVVEDPNEKFDDMRDRADLKRLNDTCNLTEIETALMTFEWMRETRTRLKLEKRQFSRLMEMVLLGKLRKNVGGSDTTRSVRLLIKKRLFEKNKEGLVGMDDETRRDKLQTAYEALAADYHRIMENVDLSFKRGGDAELQPAKRSKMNT